MRTYKVLLVVFIAAWSGSSAYAQSDVDPEFPNGDPRQRPMHGLYVRGGFGFGGFMSNVIATERERDDSSEGTVGGVGMTSELTVGGAVSDNWVLGGGVWNAYVFTSDYTHISGETIPRGLQRPQSATLVGFMADWRFAPELGMHAQAALGVAGLWSQRIRNGELDGSTAAFGPGLTLGLGADFWITQRWAFGAIARLTAAATVEEENGEDYVHGVVAPALLITVAYNE